MLLLDGDILCYRIGFVADKENESASYALRALRNFIERTLLGVPGDFTDYAIYMTGDTNFRNDVAVTAPYKGNREGDKSRKPVHFDAIKDALLTTYEAELSVNEEADDLIAIKATELGDDCCICSLDKDFDQVAGWHHDFHKNRTYYVTEKEGLRFLYQQILAGDRVDNIIGLHGVGMKRADKRLGKATTEEEYYSICVDAYGEEARVIENARLLYLRRKPLELWLPPMLRNT